MFVDVIALFSESWSWQLLSIVDAIVCLAATPPTLAAMTTKQQQRLTTIAAAAAAAAGTAWHLSSDDLFCLDSFQ